MRVTAFAPGRVNLLGEHTDYNAGLALPFAIDRGVTVRVTPLPGDWCMARAADLRESDDFDLRDPGRASGWRAFVRGTVAELRPPRAVRLEIRGTVPRGGGLASSGALGCALALALAPDDLDRRELARLASRVENEWVGAHTGLLDQYAAFFAQAGHALLIDFAEDTIRRVPFNLGDWRLVVVRAGSHDHAAGGYNDRRRECAEGHPARLRHVETENERVRAAVAALQAGDVAALGPLLDASHRSLRDDFEVSTQRVERVVKRLKAGGAAGARLVGGGFGGHVLALFEPGAALPSGAFAVAPSRGAYIRNTP